MINSSNAAASTNVVSFLLVKVMKNGRPICQILEAPGELYFNPEKPAQPFPAYVNTIINSSCRKVWAVMVEPDWSNPVPRNNYVSKIRDLKVQMMPRDKTVFVFNKIDKTPYVLGAGQVNIKEHAKILRIYIRIFSCHSGQTSHSDSASYSAAATTATSYHSRPEHTLRPSMV